MNSRFNNVSKEIATQFGTIPEHLYLSDENEDLMLIHYADMKNWKRVKPESDVLAYRGWVVEKGTGKVLARSFDWTPEYIVEEAKEIKHSKLTLGYYGTILRAFWYQGKFFISTHRRLTCEKSRWGKNVSFMSMVKDAEARMGISLQEMCKSEHCYVFLLVHPDNQVLKSSLSSEPTLFHLDTWREGTKADQNGLIRMIHVEDKLDMPSYSYLTTDQVEDAVNNDWIIISRDGVGQTVKYVTKNLQRKFDLRGQNPNLYYSWFMWMHSKQQEEFEKIVPDSQAEEIKTFPERYQREKKELEDYLYKVYTERAKELHPVHYNVMKKLHELFQQRRDAFFADPRNQHKKFFWGRNKVETEQNIRKTIESILVQADTTTLYKCITEMKKLKRQAQLTVVQTQ